MYIEPMGFHRLILRIPISCKYMPLVLTETPVASAFSVSMALLRAVRNPCFLDQPSSMEGKQNMSACP